MTAPRLPDDGKVRFDSHIPRPFPGRFDAVTGQAPGRIVTPLMRLRDPQYTKILLVTLAETTPVSEAARLQADLRRAKIEPFAWVINGSLAAAGAKDPCLGQRVAGELEQIEAVRQQHAQRIAILLWMLEEPAVPLACSHWHAVG